MNIQGKQPVLTETYTVRTHHFDCNGRFTMLAFCRILLDAAGIHAHDLCLSVPDLMNEGMTWMLARFGVNLIRLPFWREKLKVTTWPSGIERLSALRDFEAHGEDGSLIGTGVSSWLMIELTSRRPVKVEPYLAHFIPEAGLHPGRGHAPRLTDLTEPTESRPFTVRRSDIDFNDHVTSTSYIAWALESVPEEITQNHIASGFDINFRAETFPGETILSQSRIISRNSDITIMHQIVREHDNQELARAQSVWHAV